jgi:hypothetical protein
MSVTGFSLVMQLKRLLFMRSIRGVDGSLEVVVSTTLLNFVTFTSLAVTLADDGVHCKDSFGVVFHQARYMQWVVTMPLLGYATVSPESGVRWNFEDIGVVVSLFMCVLCRWCFQFMREITILHTALSIFFLLAIYYFLYMSYVEYIAADHGGSSEVPT